MNDKSKRINIRESNYEIMRILSMFFIVLYHCLLHGKIFENATGSMEVLVTIIETIILVHVNSFILVTGYFQCKSKMKLSKAIAINNQTWFYKVIIMLAFIFIGIISRPDIITFIQNLLPIDYGIYWYIECYLVLYLISPILNKVINNCNKKELQKVIVILFLIISIMSTFTKDVFYNSITGRSLGNFILLYFIGAYIRNYPIDECYFMKPFTDYAKRIIYFITFLFAVLLSIFCWTTYNHLGELGSFSRYIGSIFGYLHISYASPIVLLQSVCYFLYFGTFKLKNNFINKFASYMLGVYLISENYFVRAILYDKIKLTSLKSIDIKVLGLVFILAILIFIISTVIEVLRNSIFAKIYNSKLATKNRIWYRKKVEDLGIKINW